MAKSLLLGKSLRNREGIARQESWHCFQMLPGLQQCPLHACALGVLSLPQRAPLRAVGKGSTRKPHLPVSAGTGSAFTFLPLYLQGWRSPLREAFPWSGSKWVLFPSRAREPWCPEEGGKKRERIVQALNLYLVGPL